MTTVQKLISRDSLMDPIALHQAPPEKASSFAPEELLNEKLAEAGRFLEEGKKKSCQYDQDEYLQKAAQLFIQADDLRRAFEAATRIVDQSGREAVYDEIGRKHLNKGDQIAALRTAHSIIQQAIREPLLGVIAQSFALNDVRCAQQIASTLQLQRVKDDVLRSISQALLAEGLLQEAIETNEQVVDAKRKDEGFRDIIVLRCVFKELPVAFALLERIQTPELKDKALSDIISTRVVFFQESDAALEWTARIQDVRIQKDAVKDIIIKTAQFDPDKALTFYRQLGDDRIALAVVRKELSQGRFDKAQSIIQRMKPGPSIDLALCALSEHLTLTNPDAPTVPNLSRALEVVGQIADDRIRANALSTIAFRVAPKLPSIDCRGDSWNTLMKMVHAIHDGERKALILNHLEKKLANLAQR